MTAASNISTGVAPLTRAVVEDFLFEEAALLDSWDLDGWLALFEVGGMYQVPTTDAPRGADPSSVQHFVADDWHILQARVRRLKSRNAHAENPHSTTHRLVSNVRVLEQLDDQALVSASFIIHRIRDRRVEAYLGTYEHTLAVSDQGLRFRVRRAVLSHEELRPGGRLSFIL